MREYRELGVGPEPLPAGLRLLPPRLPPAPPGTSSPRPSNPSPGAQLAARLLDSYENAAVAAGLLEQWEGCAARDEDPDDELIVKLHLSIARISHGLRSIRELALYQFEPEMLREFELRLYRLERELHLADRVEIEQRHSLQRLLLAGARTSGYSPQDAAVTAFWTCGFRSPFGWLPPREFGTQLVDWLLKAIQEPYAMSSSRAFERCVLRRFAAVCLAALEAMEEPSLLDAMRLRYDRLAE